MINPLRNMYCKGDHSKWIIIHVCKGDHSKWIIIHVNTFNSILPRASCCEYEATIFITDLSCSLLVDVQRVNVAHIVSGVIFPMIWMMMGSYWFTKSTHSWLRLAGRYAHSLSRSAFSVSYNNNVREYNVMRHEYVYTHLSRSAFSVSYKENV